MLRLPLRNILLHEYWIPSRKNNSVSPQSLSCACTAVVPCEAVAALLCSVALQQQFSCPQDLPLVLGHSQQLCK